MNLSENISFALGRGINTRQKIPVLILAITILAKAGEAIFWLLYGIFDASFFQIFVNIFSVLFTLAFVALAVYIALLFLSNKKPIYLITVIFFVVYILAGESVLRYLSMPIIVLCLCFPSLGDGSNEHRSCTKLAIISAVVAIVIKLLQGIIAFDISFRLAYSLGFFTASFDGFALLMSLPCLILSAENTGGVGSAVKFLSAEGEKLGSKLAERSGEMVSIAKEKGVGIGKFSQHHIALAIISA